MFTFLKSNCSLEAAEMAQRIQEVAGKPGHLSLTLGARVRCWMGQHENWLEAPGLECTVTDIRDSVSTRKK